MAGADKKSNDQQILQAAFDVASQALKTVLDASSQITIDSATDSIVAVPVPLSASADVTTAQSSVVLASQPCDGVGMVSIFTKTTLAITGAQQLTVQVSPDGINWADTSLTVTPNASVVVGQAKYVAPVAIAANFIRVSTAAAISAGAYTVWLVAGN